MAWDVALVLAFIGAITVIYWTGKGIAFLISNLEWVAQ